MPENTLLQEISKTYKENHAIMNKLVVYQLFMLIL